MSKKLKISVCIPSAGMVHMGFAYSLVSMFGEVYKYGLPSNPEYTDIELTLDVLQSSVIHANREYLVDRAIEAGCTHVMFLDDDMTFNPAILDLMLSRKKAIVCVNYMTKSDDPKFVAVDLLGQRVPTKEDSTGLQKIAYSGFGVSLFDINVFKQTPKPWFLPEYIENVNTYTTEDNPAYAKFRKQGYSVYLDQDASKWVAHYGFKHWSYKDIEWI